MGQDRETGAAGNAYGHRMGKAVAALLQIEKLSDRSNEVRWRDGLAVIKCCGPRTTLLGVKSKMLERIQAVLVACEDDSGNVEIIELAADQFRQSMVNSRSASAIGGQVKQVRRSVARRNGVRLCLLRADQLPILSR
ncbi:hypothetical protein IED13_10660 [Bosea sp. SSUT16]|jgi:hypothetical protein|uniref:Uncharacterized protein n=1 Tax=Bosea spartocytisi TaxID=2773451 RepID=A0A927E8B3_9HYPH|nr:hypothetical protein [Bosea spartocytisi]MBD3846159.1 hypothetical protein [Bosea spartocytisi]MCT4473343.1 hypothetical protein [Bosea spartocytisi]